MTGSGDGDDSALGEAGKCKGEDAKKEGNREKEKGVTQSNMCGMARTMDFGESCAGGGGVGAGGREADRKRDSERGCYSIYCTGCNGWRIRQVSACTWQRVGIKDTGQRANHLSLAAAAGFPGKALKKGTVIVTAP